MKEVQSRFGSGTVVRAPSRWQGRTSVARLAVLVALLAWPAMGGGASSRGTTLGATTTARSDYKPATLENISSVHGTVEVNLTAAPTRMSLLPGAPPTDVWAYNGVIPGPTLDVHEGDHVIVHFHNKLPESTTVHWHGMHLPASQDGAPFDSVMPGHGRDYVFTVARGTAGTYWYHPHPDRRTGEQVAKGLFGTLIVRAPDDPIPSSIPERLLILADNRFRPDGSIDLPDPLSPQGRIDDENGREGPVLFVNGLIKPTISIRSGEVQFWRIVNASAARVYRLAIPGLTFLQVGTDGGLFEKPVEKKEILLANSGRVEVLVRGTGRPGSRTTLQDLPYDRYPPQTRPKDWNETHDLLTLQYSTEPPVAPVPIPQSLRYVAPIDTTNVAVRRVVTMGQGFINGKKMDLNRVDFTGHLNTTEIWQVENIVGMDHPFHLHGFQFQVLDRDGVPEPFPSWNDLVNVPKHSTMRFVVRFTDYAGKWMYHCHILNHEDDGMMGILELKP